MRPVVVLSLLAAALPLSAQDLLAVSGGIWRVSSQTGAATPLGSGNGMAFNALAMDAAGSYWAAGTVPTGGHGLAIVHPTQGTATLVFAPTSDMRSLAFDGTRLLGTRVATTDLTAELVHIDTATGAERLIGSTGITQLQALAVHQGVCYGFDNTLGLVTIDLQTGVATDVNPQVGSPANFGVAPIQFLTSMPDGRLLGGRNFLFRIDVLTGVATALGSTANADLRGAELLQTNYQALAPRVCAGVNGPASVSVTSMFGRLTTVSFPHVASDQGVALIGVSRTSFGGTPLPIWLGSVLPTHCLLNVSPDIVVPGRASAAFPVSMTITLPLPPGITGLRVFVQHVMLEAGGLTTTQSLPVTVQS